MVILLNKTGNQTWIDGITDINAQSLNNIENAINDIEESNNKIMELLEKYQKEWKQKIRDSR